MGWRTLRRKLQKKTKRKPYRKCPKCGGRMTLTMHDNDDNARVFKHCGYFRFCDGVIDVKAHGGCGHYEELFRFGQVVERQTPTPR